MGRFLSLSCCVFLLFGASTSLAVVVPNDVEQPPAAVFGIVPAAEPMVMSSGGDTTSAAVRYSVDESGRVRLHAHSATGQLVRTLVDGWKEPGAYAATWEGTTSRGQGVSSGVYFCTTKGAGREATETMLVMQ